MYTTQPSCAQDFELFNANNAEVDETPTDQITELDMAELEQFAGGQAFLRPQSGNKGNEVPVEIAIALR